MLVMKLFKENTVLIIQENGFDIDKKEKQMILMVYKQSRSPS